MTGSKSVSDTSRTGASRRVWLCGIGAALVAALISLAVGERVSRPLFDAWQRLSPRDLSASDVRVVLIDGESLKQLGPWPWPRYHLARLTQAIAAQKPAAIGFDMLFPEPDRISPENFAALYPELSAASAAEVQALVPMDQPFGQIIGSAPVVLGRAGVSQDGVDPATLIVDAEISGTPPPALPTSREATINIPAMEGAALGHGLLNGPPDDDGVVRHVPMLQRVGARPMPGLALELARVGAGQEKIVMAPDHVAIGPNVVPVDPAGRMALRFGEVPLRNIHSAEDILKQGFDPRAFTGRIVLVGLAAEGTADVVTTPMSATAYGTLVQAQAIDAIRRGGWLLRPWWAPIAEWGAAASLSLAILLRVSRRRWLVPLGGAAIVVVGAWLSFNLASWQIDPIRPLLVAGGTALGVFAGSFVEARRERERLRETLVQERVTAAAAEGELQAARSIQLGMLPPRGELATLDPRIDIDALLEPAKSVGGDFFDVARLDADRIFFVVADVTGKGTPAALFMALSKALTKSIMLREAGKLDEAATLLNEELSRDNGEAMGVTMLMGTIDLATGHVVLLSAGHENPFLVRGTSVDDHRLDGGPPFCLVDFPYPAEPLTLAPGEALVLITDGITEAQNADGALFGAAPARVAVANHADASAREMTEALRDAVRAFEAGTEPTDDLTVMVLRYWGTPQSSPGGGGGPAEPVEG
ncbi:CHASE2 domain-containing protein [Sphingomonas montanisoli]|uniref:CHASE2 domain-containing protein n=1 Tax=Sphingomonas montanisoli TaxID=2606412 RepID=A0A5D9C2L9_9SPHN|nr:CHASE2 domain-containing protein [Sphingomonas montanisoli]TZG25826.1 CHASE2 domain-containing protein [Sphingomonas montanisoli]